MKAEEVKKLPRKVKKKQKQIEKGLKAKKACNNRRTKETP